MEICTNLSTKWSPWHIPSPPCPGRCVWSPQATGHALGHWEPGQDRSGGSGAEPRTGQGRAEPGWAREEVGGKGPVWGAGGGRRAKKDRVPGALLSTHHSHKVSPQWGFIGKYRRHLNRYSRFFIQSLKYQFYKCRRVKTSPGAPPPCLEPNQILQTALLFPVPPPQGQSVGVGESKRQEVSNGQAPPPGSPQVWASTLCTPSQTQRLLRAGEGRNPWTQFWGVHGGGVRGQICAFELLAGGARWGPRALCSGSQRGLGVPWEAPHRSSLPPPLHSSISPRPPVAAPLLGEV